MVGQSQKLQGPHVVLLELLLYKRNQPFSHVQAFVNVYSFKHRTKALEKYSKTHLKKATAFPKPPHKITRSETDHSGGLQNIGS